ncbi:putative aminotransferase [Aspergillus campestris IBT 28561]|uniref:Aminotransferase n=1 Tax=Aspergillus campestris (strain IBT 28561) TaxID=1392248 RepID=A0A2I1CVH5_ASPC2|nr:putative aminotransferase [Aspergillus campestris IBT 28561]PKY01626.1 putative aminotransferase [Aspergillus campestris IBT 28561]
MSPTLTPPPTPFGAPMRKHFLMDPAYKNLNHGSFGTHPRTLQHTLREYQTAAESRTDPFIRRTQPALLDESRRQIAQYLNVPTSTCVFVKNATTGVDTVLHNLPLGEGDVIVYFATVYGAVEKGLVSLAERRPGLGLRRVEYNFPVGHAELVEGFEDVVGKVREEGGKVKAAVFDTVVSNPGVRFPFEKLVGVCRREGILSIVDGAHGVGMIPLDLGALKPDFFTSNCHKWLYVPRSCAVLHVPHHNQHLIRTTLPTSWGFIPGPTSPTTAPSPVESDGDEKTPFERLFEFVATADDTPYLCVPAALRFRRDVCGGEDAIYAYLERLAREGADVVAAALGTDVLQERGLRGGEESLVRACGMGTVRLPVAVAVSGGGDGGTAAAGINGDDRVRGVKIEADEAPTVTKWMQDTLIDKYGTFVPVFEHGGWLWVRLSAQVYLERKDFEWLGGVLREVCGSLRAKYRANL